MSRTRKKANSYFDINGNSGPNSIVKTVRMSNIEALHSKVMKIKIIYYGLTV